MDQRQGVFEMRPGTTLTMLEPVHNLLYPPVTVVNSTVMAMLSSRWMLAGAAFLGFLNLLVCMRAAQK